MAKDKRLQIVGINYKDAPDNARRFLGRYGNPFGIVGVDGNGRAAIEWGVYGVPETFIVGRDGTIVYKMVGPVTPENIETRAEGRDRQGAEGGELTSTSFRGCAHLAGPEGMARSWLHGSRRRCARSSE